MAFCKKTRYNMTKSEHMDTEIYDDFQLEKLAKQKFGLTFEMKQVIVRHAPVGRMAEATVFLSTKNQLYTLVTGRARLTLGDVQKAITRMGMRTEYFFPPKGEPDYFERIGREKFRTVFPGREVLSTEDVRYYRSLAAYNPALAQIGEVKDGVICQFDADSKKGWRIAAEFSYRRIRTS